MDTRKDLLLKSAARLYSLGVELEMARDLLKKLVDQGVSCDSKEMKDAYHEFSELDAQRKELERQHIELRDEIEQGWTLFIDYCSANIFLNILGGAISNGS